MQIKNLTLDGIVYIVRIPSTHSFIARRHSWVGERPGYYASMSDDMSKARFFRARKIK